MVKKFVQPNRGYRKYKFALISLFSYLAIATFLVYTGLTGGFPITAAEITALGAVCRDIALGVVGIVGTFVAANAYTHKVDPGDKQNVDMDS